MLHAQYTRIEEKATGMKWAGYDISSYWRAGDATSMQSFGCVAQAGVVP